jgi:spore coat polysaccharide biosynthesis protein SpsF
MKQAITITARMKSTRLPLKVMRYIEGYPMIEHMIDRLKTSHNADMVILCTSIDPQDDILVDVAEKKEIEHFRGSKEDVLDRLYHAAQAFSVDFIASTTADNPLADPLHLDKLIDTYQHTKADYITTMGLPLGAYGYGLKITTLGEVIASKSETDTEIWGHFFEKNPQVKKIDLPIEPLLHHPEMRLTVDEEPDLRLMREIFHHFYPQNPRFTLPQVVSYLMENPQLLEINKNVQHWSTQKKK